MKNSMSLELCHAWSKQQKHDYNVAYYKKNKDKWLEYARLEAARVNGELGDNKDLMRRAEQKMDKNGKKYDDAMKKYNELTDWWKEQNRLHPNDGVINDAVRKKYEQERDALWAETRSAIKKTNARNQDLIRYNELNKQRKFAPYNPWNNSAESHMRTSVTVPSGSAGNQDRAIDKAKRAVKNATSSYTSAYKAGASTIAKAGKDFVKTWMSGWR